MATSVLLRTLEFLRPMSDYRRAVVFVTPSAVSPNSETGGGGEANTTSLQNYILHHETLDELHDVDSSAVSSGGQLARIPVYTFSAQGLPAPTSTDIRGAVAGARMGEPLEDWFGHHVDTLRTIADLTGGRATVATNAPADGAPAMFNAAVEQAVRSLERGRCVRYEGAQDREVRQRRQPGSRWWRRQKLSPPALSFS